MTPRIKTKIFELPKGSTYVRVKEYSCCNGEKPIYTKSNKHDVLVGYKLISERIGKFGMKLLDYEIYHLRQWDFPICIPIDDGGCYTGDMTGYEEGWANEHSHPYEAIPVSEMFERMGISKESVIKE